jgi:hypothetical protein
MRKSPLFLGLFAAAGLACASPVPAQTPPKPTKGLVNVVPDPGGISGIWISARFNRDFSKEVGGALATPEEQARLNAGNAPPPPLLPWAQAILDQRKKDADAGHPYAFTKSRCLPAGTPMSMFPPAALPIDILETPNQVTVLFEEFNQFRVIHLNAKHQDDPDPGFFGDSVGHWEGETLVVDTIGIKDVTTLGNVGVPHSDQLHVVERLHRTAPDMLQDDITMTDPKAFRGEWHMTSRLMRLKGQGGDRLEEYFCENDRNTPDANGHTGIALPK